MKYFNVITVSACLLLTYLNVSLSNKIDKLSHDYNDLSIMHNSALSLIDEKREYMVMSSKIKNEILGQEVSDHELIISESNAVRLSKVVPSDDGSIFLIYVPSYSCIPCIDSGTDIISKIDHTIESNNILVVLGFSDTSDVRLFKRANQYSDNVLVSHINKSLFEKVNLNQLTVLIIDSNNHVQNVFIPNKNFPEVTDHFISFSESIM